LSAITFVVKGAYHFSFPTQCISFFLANLNW